MGTGNVDMGGLDVVKEKHFYKSANNGYIEHVGFGYGFPEMTEEEYQAARDKLLNAPEVEEGQEARLRKNLTWEVRPREEYEKLMEQEAMTDASDVCDG